MGEPKLRHKDVIVARERAHAAFDQLHLQGWYTKDQAYEWLANTMKMDPREAHIGRLSIEQCEQLYNLVTTRLAGLAKNARDHSRGKANRVEQLVQLHGEAEKALRTQSHGACYNALRAIVVQLESILRKGGT